MAVWKAMSDAREAEAAPAVVLPELPPELPTKRLGFAAWLKHTLRRMLDLEP